MLLYRSTPYTRSEFSPKTREAFGIDEDGGFSDQVWEYLPESKLRPFSDRHHSLLVVAYQND